MDLVFDIETDDLKATLVHCIVAQDMDTGEIYKFPPDKLILALINGVVIDIFLAPEIFLDEDG